jgi:hypothetical protein
MLVTDMLATSRAGETQGKKTRTVQNAKPDHSVSLKIAADPGRRHEREALNAGSFADESGSNQGQTGLRSETSASETSANDEGKSNVEKSLGEVAAKQDEVPEVKAEIRTEVRTSS